MSYPYDNPSLTMSSTWNSGSYTPDEVVKNIRDNYTPINKNGMRNSVGHQISLIQNYINSKYIGRSDIPIEKGFIQNLSGSDIQLSGTCNAQKFECSWDEDNTYYQNITNERNYLFGYPNTREVNGVYKADSINLYNIGIGGGYPKYYSSIENSGLLQQYLTSTTFKNSSYISPVSGIGFSRHAGEFGYQKIYSTISITNSGFNFDYSDEDNPINNKEINISVEPTQDTISTNSKYFTPTRTSSAIGGIIKGYVNITGCRQVIPLDISHTTYGDLIFLGGYIGVKGSDTTYTNIQANIGTEQGLFLTGPTGIPDIIYGSGEAKDFEYTAVLARNYSTSKWQINLTMATGLFDMMQYYSFTYAVMSF